MQWAADVEPFDSRGLYRLLKSRDGNPLPAASFVCDSSAPKGVQFFTWFLIQDRIQSRSNLLRKKVVDTAVCEICQEEIAEHVIKGCPFAREFWAKIGFSLPFVSFWRGGRHSQCQLSSFLPSEAPQYLRSPLLLAAAEAQEWDYLQVRNNKPSTEHAFLKLNFGSLGCLGNGLGCLGRIGTIPVSDVSCNYRRVLSKRVCD